MMIKSVEEIFIYESPDGGKTVFSRKPGETNRTLHSISPEAKQIQKQNEKWVKYQDIIRKADSDTVLADMLEKIELYYDLKYA